MTEPSESRWDPSFLHFMILDVPVGTAKAEVILSIVEELSRRGFIALEDVADCTRSVLQREVLASTGLELGVGCPILRSPNFSRTMLPEDLGVCVARVPNRVDFESLDGEPVELLFLILRRPDFQPRRYLILLEWISRLLREKEFLPALRQTSTEDDLRAVFRRFGETTPFPSF